VSTSPGSKAPAPSGSEEPAPLAAGARADGLDVLRGFALLGILLAHAPGFSGWDTLPAAQQVVLGAPADATLQFLRDALIRGKFYSLFSLLFGFGASLQLASATRQGVSFTRRFARRQVGLVAIGVVHSAFWHGDILLTYGLLGLLLIPTARWPTERVLRWALGLFAARFLWSTLMLAAAGWISGVGDGAIGDGAGDTDVAGTIAEVTAGYASTEWRAMLAANAHFLRLKWLLVLYDGRLFSIAAFFLLGAGLGRLRLHERVGELRDPLRRTALALGTIGLVGNAVLAAAWPRVELYPPSPAGAALGALYAIAVPASTIAGAAALALVWHTRRPAALAWLAAPGRTALTTYLTQTVVGIGVFYGVGLGLRGTLSLTESLAYALPVFALQAVAARLWLARFAFGPCEWAWRCWTYRRRLPLRA